MVGAEDPLGLVEGLVPRLLVIIQPLDVRQERVERFVAGRN